MPKEIARCSFCSRPRNEVKALISAGVDTPPYICNRCIDQGYKACQINARQEQAEKEKDVPLLKPMEIFDFLAARVIGQERAKTDIAIAVYNHYRRREALRDGFDIGDVDIQKSNILLMGPSGTGKTEIARALAKMLNVPFYIADATKFTAAGYVGDDVESMLQGLLQESSDNLERAQWGVVLIDEIDKLARKSGRGATGFRDVGGEMVQQGLLKILEGTRMAIPRGMGMRMGMAAQNDMFDTTNVLFICAGSFDGIQDVISKRVNNKASLGFGAIERKRLDTSEIYLSVTEADVLEFGIIPEMMGRLPVLTTTLALTEDQLVEILTKPKNAITKQFQKLFELDGIQLQFEEAALRSIAREAMKRPTGARALRSIVEDVLRPYSFEVRSQGNVRAIRITEDTVEKKGEALVMRVEQTLSG